MNLSELTVSEIEECIVAVKASCNGLGGPSVKRVAGGDLPLEFPLQ